jgi:hypothetical protein
VRQLGLDPLRRPHGALLGKSLSTETSVTSPPLRTLVAPGQARRGRLHRLERYYVGRRPKDTEVYSVSRVERSSMRASSARSRSFIALANGTSNSWILRVLADGRWARARAGCTRGDGRHTAYPLEPGWCVAVAVGVTVVLTYHRLSTGQTTVSP